MIPKLDIRVSKISSIRRMLRVPPNMCHRVIIPFARNIIKMIEACRAFGFKRVRILFPQGIDSLDSVQAVIETGAQEVEIALPICREMKRKLVVWKERGLIKHIAAVWNIADPLLDESWADELVVCADKRIWDEDLIKNVRHSIEKSNARYISCRGLPPCIIVKQLDRVIANSISVDLDHSILVLRFDDPEKVFFEQCGRCPLSLGCDGFPLEQFIRGKGTRLDANNFRVDLDCSSLLKRMHPLMFYKGQTHVLPVLFGIRRCGRMAISEEDLGREVERLRHLGLYTTILEPHDVLNDSDRYSDRVFHLFFSREKKFAEMAANIEKFYGHSNGKGISPSQYAEMMGRLFSYPECCIRAFVMGGDKMMSDSLIRSAYERSSSFSWLLNCLDPLSPFTLIPHLPCRFDCKDSMLLATKVADITEVALPFFSESVKRNLQKPYLFLGLHTIVSFCGYAKDNKIYYTNADMTCFRPNAPICYITKEFLREAYTAIILGNMVTINEYGILIEGNGVRFQWVTRERPLLFDFK